MNRIAVTNNQLIDLCLIISLRHFPILTKSSRLEYMVTMNKLSRIDTLLTVFSCCRSRIGGEGSLVNG